MRVPEEVRECVVYLGLPVNLPDGSMAMNPVGTGFLVFKRDETLENWGYSYLATAKHVAEALTGKEFVARVNRKEGDAALVKGLGVTWWYHPTDAAVDVALFPWAPSREKYDFRQIDSEMFLTDEIISSQSIGPGDEVFITGLFAHFAGSQRNIPIVRMGNIAMMPREPVPTTRGNIDAYLIEARSIGGLSGSPAFVRSTVSFGMGKVYLLGLMHGHWDIPPDAIDDSASEDQRSEKFGRVNMGIAIVIPAKKILDVLNQQGLIDMRRSYTEEERKKRQPPLDEATLSS